MQKEIRRCHDNLVSIGTGVALFGIWTSGFLPVKRDLAEKSGLAILSQTVFT